MAELTRARDDENSRLPSPDSKRYICPGCEAFSQHEFGQLLRWREDGNEEPWPGWAVQRCVSCDTLILWNTESQAAALIYPQAVMGERANTDMPKDVLAIYDEARRVATISRRSSAALLRLALQMLVDQLEPGAGAINTKIGKLVQSGLNPAVQQAMDVLRVIGNNAVHPGQISLDEDPDLLPGLFRLINFVVDQMISIPKHTQALFASLPQGARQQISQRDASTGP